MTRLRMPREDVLKDHTWIAFDGDGNPCACCAVGWINWQLGNWRSHFGFQNDFYKHSNCDAILLPGVPISSEFGDTFEIGAEITPLDFIAKLMRDLGHEPVYDPDCTDPPWMTPIEEVVS